MLSYEAGIITETIWAFEEIDREERDGDYGDKKFFG